MILFYKEYSVSPDEREGGQRNEAIERQRRAINNQDVPLKGEVFLVSINLAGYGSLQVTAIVIAQQNPKVLIHGRA